MTSASLIILSNIMYFKCIILHNRLHQSDIVYGIISQENSLWIMLTS